MRTRTSIAGNKRGFTLLELIIVLFVAGTAVSVVVVAAGRLHEKTVFNEETRKIYQTLKHAREVSLFERREVAFRIDEEGTRYWLDYGGSATSDSHSLRKGFAVNGKDVIFFQKGNSSGGQIKISDGKGQENTVKVDPVLGVPSIKRF